MGTVEETGTPNGRAQIAPSEAELRRRELPSGDGPVVDGLERPAGAAARWGDRLSRLLTSRGEREEAELEGRLLAAGRVTRTNTIAVLSPKGGVGKTTCTFMLGNALASHLKLRCLAIDADPDFGTLGTLPREGLRPERTLDELLGELDTVSSAPELRRYVSSLPTGLDILPGPASPGVMAGLTPEHYGALTAFLGRFYDVLLLDLGSGVTGPLAGFAVQRADQTVLVTTPEWVTARSVLGALDHLAGDERLTLVLNQAPREGNSALEAEFRRRDLRRWVTIPYDSQLATMLDSGTYALPALRRGTRAPVKRLSLAAAELLV